MAGNYEPMLHCRWELTAEDGNVMDLSFSRFDIESDTGNVTTVCPRDYIEVSQGTAAQCALETTLRYVRERHHSVP